MIVLKQENIERMIICARQLSDEDGRRPRALITKVIAPERMRGQIGQPIAPGPSSNFNVVMYDADYVLEFTPHERIEVHTDSGHVLTIGSAFPTVIYADRRLHEEDVAGTITYLGGQWEGVDLPTTYARGADAAHWKRIAEDRLVAANQSLERARTAENERDRALKIANLTVPLVVAANKFICMLGDSEEYVPRYEALVRAVEDALEITGTVDAPAMGSA